MNPDKKAARIAGAFILISVTTSSIGGSLIVSMIKSPTFLTDISSNTAPMVTGVLLELVCAVLVIGIPLTVFPILKRHSESMALGFLVFRSIEGIFTIVCEVAILSLVALSQECIKAAAPDAAYFSTLGALLVTGHYWAYDMVCIACGLAYFLFYYGCYQSKIIPRWISVWGLIGMPVFIGTVLSGILTNHPGMLFKSEYPAIIIILPAALNELFLALWLIVKGFKPSAIASPSAGTDRTTIQ